MFLTFEGVEGCGKSTQAKKLSEYLVTLGYEVVLTREPGGIPIAEQIRSILLDPANDAMTSITELLLYLAARAQHLDERVKPALKQDKIVICDRFVDSTLAYQGYARGLDLDLIMAANKIATSGLDPDLTFVFDLTVETAFSRKGDEKLDRLEREAREFHDRVRNGYLSIAEMFPTRVKVIDATQTIEEIHCEVRQHIATRCKTFFMETK